MVKDFEKFSREHIAFHVPEQLPEMLKKVLENSKDKKIRILDIGCGECNQLIQLIKKGVNAEFYGIDLSEKKIERAKKITKGKINLSVGDATETSFKNNYFDLVICTQLIEHVDDEKLVKEIQRILKKGGVSYVTSVIRKQIAIYFYRKNGRFISDPSHEREYGSGKVFSKLFSGFEILEYDEQRFRHPFLDLYFRFFIKIKIMNPEKAIRIYERNKFLFFLRKLIRVPLIGFFHNEILVKKI